MALMSMEVVDGAKLAAVALPLVMMRLSVVQRDTELERVLGEAVLDSLNSAHLTIKEAASMMKVDESNLRSMLRGDGKYHLGLVHVARLPFIFWTWFGPTLFSLMVKRHVVALRDALDLSKAS